MASESTAIVELIQLAQQKALPRDSDADLMFAPPPTAPPRRFPRATGFEDDHAVTHRIVRHDRIVKPLLAATIAVASVAAFGLTVRLTRHKPAVAAATAEAAPAPKPVSEVVPAAPTVQPSVQPIEAPTVVVAKPQLVALSLESRPSGADVTLVDGTRSAIAGTTPLSLSVDPSREYDIVFTLAGHPTKLAHVDPRTTQKIAIDLAPVSVQPPDPPARHRGHAQANRRGHRR